MEQVSHTRTAGQRWRSLSWRWSARLLIVLVALAVFSPTAPPASAKSSSGASVLCGCPMWLGYVQANNEAGMTISGLVIGKRYTLYITGGSWQAHGWGGPLYYHGWVTNNGSTWYRMGDAQDGHDVDDHWPNSWVEPFGTYFILHWTATTTSIRFRVADAPGQFYDNSGALALELREW